MKKLITVKCKLLILNLLISFSHALGTSDFVPGFMTSGTNTETADSNLPIKPLLDTKRNNNSGEVWFCSNEQKKSNIGVNNSVFCKSNASDAVARSATYNDSSNADKSKMVDVTNKITQPTANQSSLLDQSTKNELDRYKNGFNLPIQTGENVKMTVGQNQIDFKIKY
jgi:hypothetical protein